jgi:hypothetical protein
LLSNALLHPFDVALTSEGFRIIRYCDDFVILCRTKSEAATALRIAKKALAERRLRLNPKKTALLAPNTPLTFLGYHFAADGRIIPPPSTPETVTRRIMATAQQSLKEASIQTSVAVGASRRVIARMLTWMASKLDS